MKIQIEIDENLMEEEVIIRCAGLNDIVQEVQKAVSEAASGTQTAVFSKGEQEYYFPLSKVLFFETDGNTINVHTADDIYETRYRQSRPLSTPTGSIPSAGGYRLPASYSLNIPINSCMCRDFI